MRTTMRGLIVKEEFNIMFLIIDCSLVFPQNIMGYVQSEEEARNICIAKSIEDGFDYDENALIYRHQDDDDFVYKYCEICEY